jgi:hypothetical protein
MAVCMAQAAACKPGQTTVNKPHRGLICAVVFVHTAAMWQLYAHILRNSQLYAHWQLYAHILRNSQHALVCLQSAWSTQKQHVLLLHLHAQGPAWRLLRHYLDDKRLGWAL